MNILITGATGFVGSYLSEQLKQSNPEAHLFGTGTHQPAQEDPNLKLFYGDLKDSSFVSQIIKESQPDYIYHLAAIASVKKDVSSSSETILNNTEIQLNIFEELIKQKRSPKILVVGSAQEYGLVKESDNPIVEEQSLSPVSAYGLSKTIQDLSAYTYYKSFNLPVIRLRAFNHTGPRQSSDFVVPAFAKQIAEIEKGRKEPVIEVGNLSAIKDFTDVRDIVKGYILAMENCTVGDVYNIGLGKGISIQSILDTLLSFSTIKIEVRVDQNRLRPVDLPVTICNCSKFKQCTHWEPLVPFEQTLKDILNYWRNKIQ